MLATKQEMAFSGFLALSAAMMGYFSLQIGGMSVGAVSPAAFPSVLSALIAVLSLGNMLRCGREIARHRGASERAEGDTERSGVGGMSWRGLAHVLAFVLASVAYAVSLASLGFVATTVVYLFVVSLAISRVGGRGITLRGLATSLAVAVSSTAVLYLVFVELLNVRF